jgi:hypothetical protein
VEECQQEKGTKKCSVKNETEAYRKAFRQKKKMSKDGKE